MNRLPDLKHHRWLISTLVVLAAIAISLNWLHLHPGDAYIKIMAIGASVCHQLPSHSFQRDGLQFPICARCSGLYLGCFIGILYYTFQGRKSGLPKRGYLIFFIILFIVWAGDGFNSFINDLLGRTVFYATTNTTRLVTGFGMGLVLSTALMTLFNLSVWKDPQRKPLLNNLWQVLAYMVSAALIGSLLAFSGSFIFQSLAYLVALTILLVISALYTIFWVIVSRKENTFESLPALAVYLAAGFATAMLQVTLLSALRLWLIGR